MTASRPFEVEIRAVARPMAHSAFDEREASFTIQVNVLDAGIDTSAHAIRDALIDAAVMAARLVTDDERRR
jgi:hypothetical protein